MKKNKMPDKRTMEKMNADLSRLIEGKNFESDKDLKAFLNGMVGKSIPETVSKSAVDKAQDLVYEAWDTEDKKMRITIAKKALVVSSDCADAYNLLAEEEAETLEEARDLYRKGMAAGERSLGEEFFKENKGYFWGFVQTRPYMRSRVGYMECLWLLGEHEEAIGQAREMLKLNKSDNQGIRYILLNYLAELGRYGELEKFMKLRKFRDDCAAEWLYTRALLAFVKHGASTESDGELRTALNENRFAPEYLCGLKAVPDELPDSIIMGGEDEGFCYAAKFIKAWKQVPGAIEWLKKQTGIRTVPKVGRNEPCPCGSGKKYKKCCGE